MDEQNPDINRAKNELRSTVIRTRRERSEFDRLEAARANSVHLLALLAGPGTICAYLPLASEPLRTDLLDALVAAGSTVLVPVVDPEAPLDWCTYPAPTIAGAFGIAEPTGPRLGPAAVTRADSILVPALAVDRSGARLGRGGGHYDRTLALLGPLTPLLVAVLYNGELLDRVPTDPHDQRVTAAVQPTGGIRHLRS